MVTVSLALLILSIVLFIVEMFIPGYGICGIIGLVLFIVSSVIIITLTPYGIVIVLGEAAFFALSLTAAWKYMKRHQLHGKIILNETLNTETAEIGAPDSLLGKVGVTKTPLKPIGVADFNGAQLEVYSDGVYISEGTHVKIVKASRYKITVSPIQ